MSVMTLARSRMPFSRRPSPVRPNLENLEGRCQPGTFLPGNPFVGLDQSMTLLLENETSLFRPEPRLGPASHRPEASPGEGGRPLPFGATAAVAAPGSRGGILNLGQVTSPAGRDDLTRALAAALAVVRPERPGDTFGLRGGGGRASPTGPNGEGTWVTLTPMPVRRQEISTAVYNGEIYVMAGYDENGDSTSTVEVYNPATDSWRFAGEQPIANNHNAAAVAAGGLYSFGGVSNRVFLYDPKTDSWGDVAPMHYQHNNTPAVAVIDDRIYVAGGTGPGMKGNEVEVYDPFKDQWTDLAPMNVPRNHTGGGAIDGLFYVATGRDGPDSETAFEVYDPKADQWTRLPDVPTGRSGVGAGVVNGSLYVFGGEGGIIYDNVEAYNPADGFWRQLAPMQTPRHGLFASVIGNVIYLPGGATQVGFAASDVNEAYVIG